jgi:MazG family protein
MPEPRALEALARLLDIMARLRGPDGCPWDREQTPESLRPYLVEEAYEVLDAIDRGDAAAVRDELGDLLLQVVFHAQLASEAGRFAIADVADAIANKLVRRHPHVFADVRVRDADEVARNWSRIKAEERRAAGHEGDAFSAIPAALPALMRAEQIGAKAAPLGLDWSDVRGVLAKLDEERSELDAAVRSGDRDAAARELGDLLLTVASVARHLDVSPELALRAANERFVARARHVVEAARARGAAAADLPPTERDALWEAAKREVNDLTTR